MNYKLLIVEDDLNLNRLMSDFLKKEGFTVTSVTHGENAIFSLEHQDYSLVILDINLPDMSGHEVTALLRKKQFSGKILMLTANHHEQNELQALEIGADDYVAKPVTPKVLLARINNLLQRTAEKSSQSYQFDDLTIEVNQRRVTLKDQDITLTNKEFDVLCFLASHTNSLVSRDAISRMLRGVDYDGLDRSIDLTISRLRKKLFNNPDSKSTLKTIHGRGYLLSTETNNV